MGDTIVKVQVQMNVHEENYTGYISAVQFAGYKAGTLKVAMRLTQENEAELFLNSKRILWVSPIGKYVKAKEQ